MASRNSIVAFLNDYLKINEISDKSINGLQVEGIKEITKIGLATDAAQVTYEKAIENNCQMLLVHHGLIWGGLKSITGRNFDHLKYLLQNNLNLYAAHLPLDLHPEVGNNALLANLISLVKIKPFGDYYGINIGFCGTLKEAKTIEELETIYAGQLDCKPFSLSFGPKKIKTVAIISGGGASLLDEAINKEIDCLVTGEGTHDRFHLAKEGKIHLMYLGHYKSETVGVKALGKVLEQEFCDLTTVFIDEPTGF